MMQKKFRNLGLILLLGAVVACAPQQRYNTQRDAAIGAGIGAIAGQAIGRNTKATLLGAGK